MCFMFVEGYSFTDCLYCWHDDVSLQIKLLKERTLLHQPGSEVTSAQSPANEEELTQLKSKVGPYVIRCWLLLLVVYRASESVCVYK